MICFRMRGNLWGWRWRVMRAGCNMFAVGVQVCNAGPPALAELLPCRATADLVHEVQALCTDGVDEPGGVRLVDSGQQLIRHLICGWNFQKRASDVQWSANSGVHIIVEKQSILARAQLVKANMVRLLVAIDVLGLGTWHVMDGLRPRRHRRHFCVTLFGQIETGDPKIGGATWIFFVPAIRSLVAINHTINEWLVIGLHRATACATGAASTTAAGAAATGSTTAATAAATAVAGAATAAIAGVTAAAWATV